MNRLLCLALSLITFSPLRALDMPLGGVEIGGALQASANAAAGKVESLAIGKRITITQPDDAKAYNAQFTVPCVATIAKDERVFAIIKARVVGEAKFGEVQAKLQL